MIQFFVRVELHPPDPSGALYQKLHLLMTGAGFFRAHQFEGVTLKLPPGEYAINASLTCEDVLDKAKAAASQLSVKFSVLVSHSMRCVQYGLEPAKP